MNSLTDGAINLNDSTVTLRDALQAANFDVPVSPGGPAGSGADEIRFTGISFVLRRTITLTSQLRVQSSVTITGPGASALTIAGPGTTRVMEVQDFVFGQSVVNISGLTISGGNAPTSSGGGIVNRERLTLSNCTVRNNRCRDGGGGVASAGIENTATLIVLNSTVSENFAGTGGGIRSDGILSVQNSTITGNTANTDGGGIFSSDFRTMSMLNSTVSLNVANARGGGIHVTSQAGTSGSSVTGTTISSNSALIDGGGVFNNGGVLTMTNSTISTNAAFGDGGGIFTPIGALTLRNCTVTQNHADNNNTSSADQGGGIFRISTTTPAVTLFNTIVADNFRGSGITVRDDIAGSINALGSFNNLVTTGAGGLVNGVRGNQVGFKPNLGPLVDNGGPTRTHGILLPTGGGNAAPAGDTGSNAHTTVTTDQRGSPFVRITNGTVDIGAYEIQLGNRTVDTDVDENDGNYGKGDLSLREAILLANHDVGFDTIRFDPVFFSTPRTITLASLGGFGGVLRLRTNVTIAGPGAGLLTVNANNASRVFHVTSGVSAFIGGLTITGGSAPAAADGGGILNEGTLSLSSCTVTGNQAALGSISGGGRGGGIHNQGNLTVQSCIISGNSGFAAGGIQNAGGTLTLRNSTVTSNHATDVGGGVINGSAGTLIVENSTVSNNQADFNGGGVVNAGTATIQNSTISNNFASRTAGGVFTDGNFTLRNSTVSGNRANIDAGGIHHEAGSLTLENSTITQNHANNDNSTTGAVGTGGGVNIRVGTVTLTRTIVARNFRGSGGTGPDDIAGFVNATGSFNNLIGTGGGGGLANGVNGNLVAVPDPRLGPLANNGGTTLTHALLSDSPAVNAGGASNTVGTSATFTFDQRGNPFARVVDGTIDIGAYELQSLNLVVTNTADVDNGSYGRPDPVDSEDFEMSLREAVRLCNENPGPDTITFLPSFFNIPRTIALASNLAVRDDLDLIGPGADRLTVTRTGAGTSQLFSVGDASNAPAVTLFGLTLLGGTSASAGGGILNHGRLNVQNCVISNCQATGDGGAIANFFALAIHNSTLSGNSAARGGAVFNEDARSLFVINSTISGNQARGDGGGIYNDGTIEIDSSTLTLNRADSDNNTLGAGGGMFVAPSTVILHNTLVADNFLGGSGTTAENNFAQTEGVVVDATSSFNLIGAGGTGGLLNGFNGNLVGVADPRLAPLANNGGPTPTHALFSDSPAIDAGDPAFFIPIDQRDAPRPIDGNGDGNARGDIGAFEFSPVGTARFLPAHTNVVAGPGDRVDFAFSWTVPDPGNWHDLEWLQLRILDGEHTILWLKFDEATQTFSISKNADGTFGGGEPAGSNKRLTMSDATLHLAETSVQAAGATSPTVTLHLSLSFKPRAAGRQLVVEVAAQNDQGVATGFEQAGSLRVTSAKAADVPVEPDVPAPVGGEEAIDALLAEMLG